MQEDLATFLSKHRSTLLESINRAFPPQVVRPNNLPEIKRTYMGRQDLATTALLKALKQQKGAFLVGEMGVGKTTVAAAVAGTFRRTLVLCPPHLVQKWKREVEATVPGVHVVIAERISDLEHARALPDKPLVVVVSRERAKLGPQYHVGARPANKVQQHQTFRNHHHEITLAACPDCGRLLHNKNNAPLTLKTIRNKQGLKCTHCGTPLTTPKPGSHRRYPLAEYVKRRMRGFFDLLVLDEAHEYKGADTAQGNAAGMLAESVRKVLVLTGTLFGGYASSIYYLLWRFSDQIRHDYKYDEVRKFVETYGATERVKIYKDDGYGASTRKGRTSVRSKEIPATSPLLLKYLLPMTVFIRLEHVSDQLPSYGEQVALVKADQELARWYNQLTDSFQQINLRQHPKLLGAYLQNVLHAVDTPWVKVDVSDPDDPENTRVYLPPLTQREIWPKEGRLIELIEAERRQGRRVLVYVQGTQKRDITKRLKAVLARHRIVADILTSNTATPRKREEWIRKRVAQGLDALILHPKLVQTGLDLVDFPTIIFYQVEPSIYTLRQAARRSWRLGQKHPVKVIYLAYKNTMQQQALVLLASKALASLAMEGDLVQGGLAGVASADASLSMAMSLAQGKNLDIDPNTFAIAGVGVYSQPLNGDTAQVHKKATAGGPLPTVAELGIKTKGKRSSPSPNTAVLFPEVFTA